jgi:hypothetical protein
MTWEQALAPSLEQTLNLILSALANFFGTTTQAIMANAPESLAKYGWYVTLHNELGVWMFGGAFAGALLVAGFLAIWCMTNHEIKPTQIFISICFFFLGFIVVMSIPIITCLVAPEIVGLEAAIELIS